MNFLYQLKAVAALALVLLLTACGGREGKAPVLPADCVPEDFHFVGQHLVLLDAPEAKQGQRLYGLKNISLQNVGLDHLKSTPEMNAGWTSELAPQHWSALALAPGDFAVICLDLDHEKNNVLSCQDVLLVCRFAHARFTEAQKGSYWVSENLSDRKLLGAIGERGVELK